MQTRQLESEPLTIIEYCTEEVRRQGHDTKTLDGIDRVSWMLSAWSYALYEKDFAVSKKYDVTERDIEELGRLVEPDKNNCGYRQIGVGVKQDNKLVKLFPDWPEVPNLLIALLDKQADLAPFDFYRAFLEIHPFADGNGRVGKILLNWKNGSLEKDPIFPPADFWGAPILNP